ncbi:hypothetical protein OY671_000736 [Metschnikowia pulcherrima]|nr:hypothetical protein OY671_000736 [Metschnikowia pulcherrima]
MDESYVSVLNTPIKKIRNLTLHSPGSVSPVRYPSMSDFPMGHDSINESMLEKGYSQTLSSAVLDELDNRAKEISSNVSITNSAARPLSTNTKRYSGIHRPLFSKMESISSHYAASRQTEQTDQDISSSATKKRRTLNGPEEIFFATQDDPSPTRRKIHISPGKNGERSAIPLRQTAKHLSNDLFAGRLQPLQLNVPLKAVSPVKEAPASPEMSNASLCSSPLKTPGISPSKGSMNLHGLLSDDSKFAKPEGPVRIRQSSLQMAGVKPSMGGIPSLSRKTSNNDLNNNRAHPHLQKKPSFESVNGKQASNILRSKTSTPSLNKQPSMNNLQKKPSIPQLQRKSSIPVLQKKPSVRSFQNYPKHANLSFSPPRTTEASVNFTTSFKSPSNHDVKCMDNMRQDGEKTTGFSIPRISSSQSSGRILATPKTSSPQSFKHKSQPQKANVTVPKPFSLYSKPTISSSQKTFGSSNSLQSAMSTNSSSASQRSLNRFQKFKSRFS